MGEGGDKDRVPGEFSLIEELFAPLAGPEGLGLRDDAAVLTPRAGFDLVLTKDAIAEGRHYLPDDPPDTVARKLLRVNLSDLAAKGSTPRGYLLSCAWSEATSYEWMEGFAAGLVADQEQFNIRLWGGDTIKVDGPSVFSLTAIGDVPKGTMVKRSGAQPGDDLWVTGTIGDAALGLLATRGECSGLSSSEQTAAIERYRIPEPPVAFGKRLSESASAALDVSDGLLADMGHLCSASQVGAKLNQAAVPLSPELVKYVTAVPEGWRLVFGGGDDYQTLFTAPTTRRDQILDTARSCETRVTRMGRVTEGPKIMVLDEAGQPIETAPAGFTHF